MGTTGVCSLFFFQTGPVGQFPLVVHGGFLCNEGHVSGRRTVNRAAKNAVVGVGSTGKRFPSSTGEGVAALLAAPNADGLPFDLLVLANGARVLAGSLGHSRASISTDTKFRMTV